MSVSDAIKARIDGLINEMPTLMRGDLETDQLPDAVAVAACVGWLTAAVAAVEVVCTAPDNPYRRQAEVIRQNIVASGYIVHYRVRELAEILKRLKSDVDVGLLSSIENRVSGETFDDLLDHAGQYLAEQRKEPAGVLAGVVFEDTIRRICRIHEIDDDGATLDPMINALKAKGVFTRLTGKTAVAAADLRTSATHARWDEFKLEDVQPVIEFTRRLIGDHLDS